MHDNTQDPFALARSDEADAELYAAIAAYRRLNDAANAGGIDEDDIARLCDEARPHRDIVEKYHPVTLRGVVAALDFAGVITDLDYWPEGALEGLRTLAERDAPVKANRDENQDTEILALFR